MKHWFSHVHSWTDKLIGVVLGMTLASSVALASGLDGGKNPPPNPFPGLSLKIQDATVPPGGLYQLQLMVTEPKPVGKGSSGVTFSSAAFGTGAGASIADPSGQACGVAVRTVNGFQVVLLSANAMLGTNIDYPIVTIALPVRPDAQVGLQIPLSLNPSNAVFLDAAGQPYPLELAPGNLTIGGTLSITNVIPGGGLVPAGSTISILGMGFTPSATVDLEGANVVTTRLVSPQELGVTLDRPIVLDTVRVRVRTNTERVMYFSYLRAAETGHSLNPLIAAADPMFSRITYTTASLPWTRGGSAFTGLALQNPGTNPAQVTLDLLSAGNTVLQTFSLSLPGRSKMTEDLLDLFAQPPAASAAVRIRSSQSIQILGMHGDTAAGTIAPIVVSVP